MELDRDVDQPEADRPFPESSRHAGAPGNPLTDAPEPSAALLRIALRLLASRAAGGGALLVALLGGLRLALRLVALGLRLLHAGVLGIAFLVVALLIRDLVGGLGLGLLRLALGLRLV